MRCSSATRQQGGAEAKAELDWDEQTIALDTKVGPIGLGGKIGMGKAGRRRLGNHPSPPSRWQPGDSVVQDHLKTIKKGIEPLSKLSAENAVSYGISVSGDGPDVKVEASLIWRFRVGIPRARTVWLSMGR